MLAVVFSMELWHKDGVEGRRKVLVRARRVSAIGVLTRLLFYIPAVVVRMALLRSTEFARSVGVAGDVCWESHKFMGRWGWLVQGHELGRAVRLEQRDRPAGARKKNPIW